MAAVFTFHFCGVFMSVVQKYMAVLRIGLSNSMEYRANFIMNNVFALVVGAMVNMYLWKAVYNSTTQSTIGNLTVWNMLAYVATATVCSRMTQTGRTERNAAEEIRSGDLNKYLLKPISHAMYTLVSSFSERISALIFIVLVAVLVGIPLAQSAGVEISAIGVVAALPVLLCAMIINSLMSVTISYFAFWFDEVWTFHVVKDISLWFLSGQLLPMSALPETARSIAGLLPFQYLAYVPAGLIIGSIPVADMPGYLAGAVAWVAILSGITALIWQRGLRRFGAYGG